VVQALELTTADFVMGIQWHPEYLPQIETQQRLFRELVKLAAECMGKKD
jgi:putative glutamine amidotransferase